MDINCSICDHCLTDLIRFSLLGRVNKYRIDTFCSAIDVLVTSIGPSMHTTCCITVNCFLKYAQLVTTYIICFLHNVPVHAF